MQSNSLQILLAVVITAIAAGGGVYMFQRQQFMPSTQPAITQNESDPVWWAGVIKYNCEMSGGNFENNTCDCPVEAESGQTLDEMYDRATGYCQTAHGGPGGDVGVMMNLVIDSNR